MAEKQKRDATISSSPQLYEMMEDVYDALWNLQENTNIDKDETDENLIKLQDPFQFYSFNFPYKIRSIFSLMEMGNYDDAICILRTIVEPEIYYKYFFKKNDGKGLCDYILQTKKHGIKLIDIFEKEVPGFYNDSDGYDFLCQSTHTNPIMQSILRKSTMEPNTNLHKMNKINEGYFGLIQYYLFPFIYMHFENYKIIFKNNTIDKDEELKETIQKIEENIKKGIQKRCNDNPDNETIKKQTDYYNKLMDFN